MRHAEAVKHRVEQLAVAAATGQAVDEETARWATARDDILYGKLAAVGLVQKRDAAKLAVFIDDYIKSRGDVKESTATVYGHTRRCLVEYFKADKSLRDITPGDADQWRQWLKSNQGLADNTIRRRIGIARQFFRVALRRKLIPENPFADLSATVRGYPSRFYFVSRAEAEAVLDACPNAEWRLLFALSRYGGLRCPSEHLALRWGDIDWERGRMTVHSPKTEHHPGGESRQIPIFPELLPHLRECFELAEPGAVHVITGYRDATQNLRTQLTRIIKQAKLEPWPKLWHNLRSTRQTELCEAWPSHVVCAWLGNSVDVATRHYLQVTDEHFEQACSALQNPVQSAHAACRNTSPSDRGARKSPSKTGALRHRASECQEDDTCLMGPLGLEPRT